MGDVLIIEAWRAVFAQTEQNAPGRRGGSHVPELSFPGRRPCEQTAWGYLALRLPYPEDDQWAKDRAAILQALGIFDPSGKPTPRLAAIETYKFFSFTEDDWQAEREKALKTCNDCHSVNFARAELEKGDQMIREADALMAEGIRTVAALYQEGLLKKPETTLTHFPDLLACITRRQSSSKSSSRCFMNTG